MFQLFIAREYRTVPWVCQLQKIFLNIFIFTFKSFFNSLYLIFNSSSLLLSFLFFLSLFYHFKNFDFKFLCFHCLINHLCLLDQFAVLMPVFFQLILYTALRSLAIKSWFSTNHFILNLTINVLSLIKVKTTFIVVYFKLVGFFGFRQFQEN